MSIAFVNANSNQGSGVTSYTVTLTYTAGNLLYLFVRTNNFEALTITAADDAGNTLTQIGGNIDGPSQDVDAQFYAKNISGSGSHTITVSFSASISFSAATVLQFSGVDTTSPLDTSATGTTGGATSLTSGAFTTSQADAVIVSGASVAALSGAFTAGLMGGTAGTIPANATQSGELITAQYAIVSSIVTSGTAAISWNGGGARAEMGVAVFKAAGGGPPPAGGLFLPAQLAGLGSGGPFFQNPLN